jgi:hypothetical protein
MAATRRLAGSARQLADDRRRLILGLARWSNALRHGCERCQPSKPAKEALPRPRHGCCPVTIALPLKLGFPFFPSVRLKVATQLMAPQLIVWLPLVTVRFVVKLTVIERRRLGYRWKTPRC